MFNVTIIRLRDILKYIVIAIAIYFFGRFIIKYSSNMISFKKELNFSTDEVLTLGINNESTVIKEINEQKNISEEEKTEEVGSNFISEASKTVLQTGSNAFKIKELEESVEENAIDTETQNAEANSVTEDETKNHVQVATTTEVVTTSPIKESYNREYNGVKIKNETDFEITDEMLNSDNLSINTNNVIIFHTHTCESYTQSEKYSYEETRKF